MSTSARWARYWPFLLAKRLCTFIYLFAPFFVFAGFWLFSYLLPLLPATYVCNYIGILVPILLQAVVGEERSSFGLIRRRLVLSRYVVFGSRGFL